MINSSLAKYLARCYHTPNLITESLLASSELMEFVLEVFLIILLYVICSSMHKCNNNLQNRSKSKSQRLLRSQLQYIQVSYIFYYILGLTCDNATRDIWLERKAVVFLLIIVQKGNEM
ncbi:Hypothetical_protein [Hexamita inflata]|uniref:Hypothetical_protein n=1 Tax=Hexamita inflata TaxID=28002 RepID=A0AA86TQB4_9EUKA|nr:Hypothetical protein HINF_LOCUS7023 [Hexamita inflata]